MASCLVIGQPPAPGVTVTFLANEGVLLSSGTRKVLIDALFDPYSMYAVPHDSTQGALRQARAPFDSVDLVLVTHWHGDHFGAAPVAMHLAANPRATLVASQQVMDSLRRYAPARSIAASRTLARAVPSGERRREVINGVPVEILGVTHGSGRHRDVQHRGYIVEMGGRRILHLGDTEFTEAEFSRLRLDTARIDVALLPVWALSNNREIVERWIKPRQVVAFHLLAADLDGASRIERAWPGSVAFTVSLHKRRW
ncbi:MAG TPA: MBL fold metallo-hydrolase [Gemmatimonadaceae bacterium]|nr:MBL fold metallo-hydrolase [Gemmatimonadaceae bacterium]